MRMMRNDEKMMRMMRNDEKMMRTSNVTCRLSVINSNKNSRCYSQNFKSKYDTQWHQHSFLSI